MTPSPLPRVALVLLAYLVFAWIVLGSARWLRGILALPPLFESLMVGFLAVGAVVAAAVAWRYPAMGDSAADPKGSREADRS